MINGQSTMPQYDETFQLIFVVHTSVNTWQSIDPPCTMPRLDSVYEKR